MISYQLSAHSYRQKSYFNDAIKLYFFISKCLFAAGCDNFKILFAAAGLEIF